MHRHLLLVVNRVVARAQSLQMQLVTSFLNNRGEENLAAVGDTLESVHEIVAELLMLQRHLESLVKVPACDPASAESAPGETTR